VHRFPVKHERSAQKLNIIVHHPIRKKDKHTLEKNAAALHAGAVYSYIKNRQYTNEEKQSIIQIIDRFIEESLTGTSSVDKTP